MQSSGNNIHEMVTNNRMQSLINIKKLKADLSEIIHLCKHNNNNNDQSEKQKDETRLTRLR